MRQRILGAGIVLFLAAFGGALFAIWSFAERWVGSAEPANITIGSFKEQAYQASRGKQAVNGLVPTEAKRAFDRDAAVFVDARSSQAYEAGHIPGALYLPSHVSTTRLRKALASYPADTRIIAYCAGTDCLSSHVLTRRLVQELGYQKVEVLEGGWPAWRKAGFPVATGADAGL